MKGRWITAFVVVWLASLIVGLAWLTKYKSTSGETGPVAREWPSDSIWSASATKPTLVMFLHPRCTCSRASLTELRGVVSRFGDRVKVMVVFMSPSSESQDWVKTDTWRDAKSLGVDVVVDTDGREATRFGAETSGHVVLYDSHKKLLFSGGITPARGHVGDSPQLDRLMHLIETDGRDAAGVDHATSVFGCAIHGKPNG